MIGTGDNFNITLPIILILIAVVLAILGIVIGKRGKKK
jgi:hypothetical protein